MKKNITIISGILLVLYFVLPLGAVAAELAGYSFSLRNYKLSAAVLAAASAASVGAVCIDKEGAASLPARAFSLLLLPASLMNWFFYAVLSVERLTVLCMEFCSVCALLYMLKYVRHKASKIITAVICIIALIPLSLLSLLIFLFSGFGSNETVKTVYSPDGTYKAEVISSDQGALGGDTYVNLVKEQAELDLYIFQISKGMKQIYSGEWDEYQNMVIFWKDNRSLVINGEEFHVE